MLLSESIHSVLHVQSPNRLTAETLHIINYSSSEQSEAVHSPCEFHKFSLERIKRASFVGYESASSETKNTHLNHSSHSRFMTHTHTS